MLQTVRPVDDPGGAPARPATAPPRRVLVVLGHPRRASLCGALADAYAAGARAAGAEVRLLAMGEMRFDPDAALALPRHQAAEPDVAEARELIAWADHLAFVFPTWWGTMPAALKGFLDRVLVPGFAFDEPEEGGGWAGLLAGRSAHLLTTMDTPRWVYHWVYGAPGLRALGRATLGFCGVDPVRSFVFGPVRGSDRATRARWIARAGEAGAALRGGPLGPAGRLRRSALAWVRALRLQFHPMAWAAYATGAAAAAGAPGGRFDPTAFWLGLLALFALEAATVFVNEYFDHPSDRTNRHHGPFSGGSRVLVEGAIAPGGMRVGIGLALGAFAAAALALAAAAPGARAPLPLLAGFAALAVGYTAPPLRLCWRGLGELDVALTHSVALLLCGHAFQGGAWSDPFPWLAGVPLFWAVLAAITLAGVPDHDADRAAGKRTIAVRLGPRGAVRVAQAATALAAAAAVVFEDEGSARGAFGGIGLVVLPHAAWQVARLQRHLGRGRPPGRIDGLMALSLSYVVWFVAFPLWHLAGGAGRW